MNITSIKGAIFQANDSLVEYIDTYISKISDGSIVVITSKIIALSEGRVAHIDQKGQIIQVEAQATIDTPWATLTLMNDGWNINAGIDESNAKEGIVFLPKDAFFSAEMIRSHLKKRFHVKKIGVIVTDTKSLPLRVGTIGRSIGFAGFEPIKSYIGKKDIFGRKSRVTKSNFVDALSAAAVMIMGEGNEKTPIAIIENAPVKFISRPLLAKEKILSISPNKDIFAAVYKVC